MYILDVALLIKATESSINAPYAKQRSMELDRWFIIDGRGDALAPALQETRREKGRARACAYARDGEAFQLSDVATLESNPISRCVDRGCSAN